MHMLVAYDVSTETKEGRKRLKKVADACKNYGQRVQKSVFECSVNDIQAERLRHNLKKIINKNEDSLRIYRLMEPREKYLEVYGRDMYVDFNSPLVV
ncbi:MAG: CRISPR-associated endonuclease Cas2 [Deltaproteobacteria bacterium]|nr:CRISPR-associated endonuclease Cas2 [Deltaproteobacteria bacterium]